MFVYLSLFIAGSKYAQNRYDLSCRFWDYLLSDSLLVWWHIQSLVRNIGYTTTKKINRYWQQRDTMIDIFSSIIIKIKKNLQLKMIEKQKY